MSEAREYNSVVEFPGKPPAPTRTPRQRARDLAKARETLAKHGIKVSGE